MIKCGQCKFWFQYEGTPEGECRLKPPVISDACLTKQEVFIDINAATKFPVTNSVDWCGEGRINDVPDRPSRV